MIELEEDAGKLGLDGFGDVGNQPDQPQRLPLGLGESGGLVECGVMQDTPIISPTEKKIKKR